MRTLSTSPAAVYARNRRMRDPEFAERDRKLANARLRRKVVRKILTDAKARIGGRMADRVRLHLSRGRDAGDIAIREGIPVSVAQKFIEAGSCTPQPTMRNESAPRKRGRA